MERKQVLAPFERKRAYMEDRIEHGIEMYRKGFATLRFSTPDKQPLRDVHVEVRQKTHDFKYGANLFMLDEFKAKEQNDEYKGYLQRLLTSLRCRSIGATWSLSRASRALPRTSRKSIAAPRQTSASNTAKRTTSSPRRIVLTTALLCRSGCREKLRRRSNCSTSVSVN